MHCPRCGKENPECSNFCMHCGADLREYKVEISPKIEVSPKIHAEAKAEGIPYPKWKPKPERYVGIKGEGKLPVYKRFAEFNGKFFCPQCGNYDSLECESVLKTKHIEGNSVTIVEYDVYRCLACDKRSLIFRDSKQYQLPSVTKYLYLYGVGKVPVTSDKPEICPNCKEPAIKFKKYTYLLTSRREEELLGKHYYEYYGYEYPYYVCSSCGFGILVDSLEEKYVGRTQDTYHTKYSDIEHIIHGHLNKGDIVEKLCQFCGERAAVREEGSIEYSYKCKRCGKILCENCVRIKRGLFKYYYCPSCASSRMCQVCGEYVANYICSSCGRRICKDCADGILSKKCPYCGSKLRKL